MFVYTVHDVLTCWWIKIYILKIKINTCTTFSSRRLRHVSSEFVWRIIRGTAGASPRGEMRWTCPPHFRQSLFLRLMQIRWGRPRTWLARLQNTENEANLLLPLDSQKLKGFSFRRGFALCLPRAKFWSGDAPDCMRAFLTQNRRLLCDSYASF